MRVFKGVENKKLSPVAENKKKPTPKPKE